MADADLDPIVVEDIVIQDRAPEAPSFDTAILLGYHTAWLDDLVRVRHADHRSHAAQADDHGTRRP